MRQHKVTHKKFKPELIIIPPLLFNSPEMLSSVFDKLNLLETLTLMTQASIYLLSLLELI